MKKISILTVVALAAIGFFTLTASDAPMSAEQTQQMDQVTQMVNEQVEAFKASKEADCKAAAMEAARPKAELIIAKNAATAAKSVKGVTTKGKKVVKKVVKPAVKVVTPTVKNRPGANENKESSVKTRPGSVEGQTNDSGKKPTVTTRPGAVKVDDKK